jgi:hypothetical protein
MNKRKIANLAGPIAVTLIAGWGVKKMFGSEAGILGAVVAFAAHQYFNAPASRLVYSVIA